MVELQSMHLEGQKFWYKIKEGFWSGSDNRSKETASAASGYVRVVGEPVII